MKRQSTTDTLTNTYLDYLKDGEARSKDLGFIPPGLRIANKTVTYYLLNTAISITFPSPSGYEREMKNDEKEESERGKVPYNKKGELDCRKLVRQNSSALEKFLKIT